MRDGSKNVYNTCTRVRILSRCMISQDLTLLSHLSLFPFISAIQVRVCISEELALVLENKTREPGTAA